MRARDPQDRRTQGPAGAPRVVARAAALALAGALLAGAAGAQVGYPDPTWRDALATVRDAVRDTAGHTADAGRLDALGAALIRVARLADAEPVLRRALDQRPGDQEALAGLGRIALFRQRDTEAESLLAAAGGADGAAADLYRVRLRRHEWAAAAEMAESQGEGGRRELLERLAASPEVPPAGAERASLPFQRAWPVPLVRVKLNGQLVTMAVDFGSNELLLDPGATANCHVSIVPGERTVGWSGMRVAARNAIAQKLELGGIVLAGVPAAVTPLHVYSLQANPEGPDLAGVIGLPVLEQMGVTIDFRRQELELRRGGGYAAKGERVPFERWGENELVVYGSLAGGRRMALWVGTGLPGAALGAPHETFDEIGVQPGRVANFVRSMGTLLQGRPWSQVIVSTVTVGTMARDHVEGWSGAMDPADLWRWGVRRDAVLGPRFFENRRVTFDWDRHELVFEEKN